MEHKLKKTLVDISVPGIKGFKGDVVKRFLAIDKEALTEEMSRTPSDIVYWNVLAARLESAAEKAKNQLRFVEATCDADVRATAVMAGEKITEAKVRVAILQHKHYRSQQKECEDVNEKASIAKSVAYALSSKKDLLISLGAKERLEMDNSITTKRR